MQVHLFPAVLPPPAALLNGDCGAAALLSHLQQPLCNCSKHRVRVAAFLHVFILSDVVRLGLWVRWENVGPAGLQLS